MNQIIIGPGDGESGRSHLVGTASGSNLQSHAISSGRPILIGFSHKSFYVGLVMVQYVLLRKRLGIIPSILLVPDANALLWNIPRLGHLRTTTIFQLRRPAKPDPVAPFGDRRLPLLPLPLNENRHSQPSPWSTPSRFSKDYLK